MPAPVLQFKRGNAGVAGTVPALRPGEPAISLNNFDFFIGIDTSVANNKFFGSHRYWGREDGTNSLKLKLVDKDGTNYISVKSPNTLAGIVTYTLPGTQGSTSSVLTNDGSGNLTWSSGSANPVFSGISTFSDTTDNTLGDSNTGAVRIDGGLGVDKNVTVGGSLNVQGSSEFVGVVTFKGGVINLGDDTTDVIDLNGRIGSNLVPTTDNTYDVGISTLNWRNAHFSGIGTFETGLVVDNIEIGIVPGNATINTTSGDLVLNSAGGNIIIYPHVDIYGDLNVSGNISLGGSSITLRGTDVFIENKDIVLGYTTSITPNDTTANHAGVAIASTEGTPLVSFTSSGINTLPDTYKQMMWFQSGTLGFATDVFGFNYGVAIGTTTMANGVRLAVGSGVTVSDTTVSATTFYGSVVGNVSSADQVKTVTASDNNANYYVTFVDANNGSATNESVYTDDGIYYNPGTNTFTTQHISLTGNLNVAGITTLGDNSSDTITVKGTTTFEQPVVGTIGTATRSTLVDTTGTSSNADYYVTFVDTLAGQTSETLRVGAGLSVNPSDGSVKTTGTLSVGNASALTSNIKSGDGSNAMYLHANGDVSFQSKIIAAQIRSNDNSTTLITLSGLNATFAQDIAVTGITTTGTLKLSGTSGIGITGISTSTTLTENSDDYLPTQKAVKAYVDAVDLTTGIAADTGTSTVSTSQTLTIAGTPNEIETFTASGQQTITVGLPDAVIVGTSLSAPTLRTGTIQSSNTGATAITIDGNDVTIADDLTVSGNLYVNGNTTQVNTAAITVEDRTIELGRVDGLVPPSSTTWDLGVLFNYNASGAKKSAVIWEHSATRFQFASVLDADTNGTDVNTPQLTVTTFAPIEIGSLWVTDCAGTSQVISCTGSTRNLENITIDAGTF